MPRKTQEKTQTKTYAFVFGKERPDFFGELVSVDPDFIVLEKPMIVEYREDLAVVFNSDFMPAGYPPRYDKAFRVTIPTVQVNYVVHLDEDDKMVNEYLWQSGQRDASLDGDIAG